MDFKILYHEDALADMEKIFVYYRLDENRGFCSLGIAPGRNRNSKADVGCQPASDPI